MSEHPAPLVPAEADLSGYTFMPLFGDQLFGSDFNLEASDAEFRLAVRFWWTAWKQVPAASMPGDELKLCQLAGFGRNGLAKWRKVRAILMRNFVLCSDGRYYHRVLAPHAIAAWQERKAAIARGKASGVARRLKRPPSEPEERREQIENVSTPTRKERGDVLDLKSNKGEGEGEYQSTAFPVLDTSRPCGQKAAGEEKTPPSEARIVGLSTLLGRAKVSDVEGSKPLMQRWLSKATDSQITRAVNDACRSKGGHPFQAAYLDTVVERILAEDAKARSQAEQRVERTQAVIAEQRAVAGAPKPEGFPQVRRSLDA